MDEYRAARVGSESDAILVAEYSNRTLSLGDFAPFADAGTTPSAKHQSSVVVSAETSDESQSAGSSQPTVSKRPAPAWSTARAIILPVHKREARHPVSGGHPHGAKSGITP
jgi:hypothetical protein